MSEDSPHKSGIKTGKTTSFRLFQSRKTRPTNRGLRHEQLLLASIQSSRKTRPTNRGLRRIL